MTSELSIQKNFAWDVDGEAYDGATDGVLTSVVDGSSVGGEETWTCEGTASDGTDESVPASASTTTETCSIWYADADPVIPIRHNVMNIILFVATDSIVHFISMRNRKTL